MIRLVPKPKHKYLEVKIKLDIMQAVIAYQDTNNKVRIVITQEKETLHFTARIGRTQVGLAQVDPRDGPNPHCMLSHIDVPEHYRNRKIGSTILDAVIDYARINSYRFVVLGVEKKNEGAIRLYERKGFHKVPIPRTDREYMEEFYLMQLNL